MDIPIWATTAVVFIVAGTVKGVVGLGLPTLAMGLLSIWMSPVSAASLMLVPSLATNAWQLATGPSFARSCRRLWPLCVGIVGGTFLGVFPELGSQPGMARSALGTALFAYAVVGLFSGQLPATPARHECWVSLLMGYATGTITAATGVFVLPAVPFLQSLRLAKDDLVQALGLSFTVSTIALAAQLVSRGAFAPSEFVGSTAALAPALLGMWAGQKIRRRLSEARFRQGFFVGLGALGMQMIVSAPA
ncbi:MAG: sulfite exporter TauE/SafE family protein [Methylibium sp.]|nr:sulfite exporter TauE/SafE family protein [Methylibium sp.]